MWRQLQMLNAAYYSRQPTSASECFVTARPHLVTSGYACVVDGLAQAPRQYLQPISYIYELVFFSLELPTNTGRSASK